MRLVLIVLATTVCLAVIYLGYNNYQLRKYNLILEKELASTTKIMSDTINSLSENLSRTEKERDEFEQKYNNEKIRVDFLASQISVIQGTIGLLEKLNETDVELLQKYSKVYFLNENYAPGTLTRINPEYTYNTEKEYMFHSRVLPYLESLLSDAANDNIDIKIISAFRSFSEQSDIKYNYKMIYGSGANQFSADQGYSEHQLGTTVDITTSKIGASFSGFEKTETYQWLLNNAHKYGFILSYPEDNDYYQFEPWHWRFVGKSLSESLHEENKNFYDLEQREINQYLLFFFD